MAAPLPGGPCQVAWEFRPLPVLRLFWLDAGTSIVDSRRGRSLGDAFQKASVRRRNNASGQATGSVIQGIRSLG